VHGQGTERDCSMEAVLSGYPNVLTLHGNMRVHAARPDNGNPRYYQMAAKLEAFCLRRTGGVVAISSYTRDLVSALAPRTWLLPNAVDSRFFSVVPVEQDVPRILFVGMINERKNPHALLNCCKDWLAVNRCKLAIAGDGNPASDYYREFMDESKALPGVELLGFIDRDQLAEEMGRSSLLVLPTFEDNCPMVVLEAMAAGLPVAASRVGGVPDLIEDEVDGLMFDPAAPAEMRGKIGRLVDDPELRKRLAQAGKMKALNKFHPRAIAEEHVRIYRELLEANGK
jgi:glycosyltransferase involved in cell wall biosynthesis